MDQQIKKKHSRRPNVHLLSITILREEFRREIRPTANYFKQPFLSFEELTHGKVVKVRLVLFDPYLLGAKIAIDKFIGMHLIHNLHYSGKKLQRLRQLEDMRVATVRQFQKVGLDILADEILTILLLELLFEGDYMRALAQFFSDLECVLIRLVDLVELLHEVGLAVFGSPVVGAIIGCVDHLFLLVAPDHPASRYYI